MSDSTPKQPKSSGTGTRLANAKAKGAEAAEKGKAKDSNPYHDKRPNMVKAWDVGFDSYESADA